jgi:YcxB-like protein
MEKSEIEIEVLIEFKEYLRCNYLMVRKKCLRIFILLGIILLSCFFIALVKFGLTFYAFKISFIALIFTLSFLTLSLISLYLAVKKTFNSSAIVRQKLSYKLSENEIEAFGNSFNTKCGWDIITKAEETGGYFLLYSSTSSAFILPQRCFESDSQIADFRELVRRNLGDKAKLKG